MERSDYFTSNTIKELVKKHGIEKVKFLVPMPPVQRFMFIAFTSSSDKKVPVLCNISEKRYKLEENYKITLRPETEELYQQFGEEHYYDSDLADLIRSGYIRIFVEQ